MPDHNQTDFELRGGHQKPDREKCHEPAKKYSQAAQDCNACHRKGRRTRARCPKRRLPHRQQLEGSQVRPLEDAFRSRASTSDTRAATATRTRRLQRRAAHLLRHRCQEGRPGQQGPWGQFGEKCEQCHNDKGWKPAFNHDRRHFRAARAAPPTLQRLPQRQPVTKGEGDGQDCNSCHEKGRQTPRAASATTAPTPSAAWKEKASSTTGAPIFPPLGKHATTKCDARHKSRTTRKRPRTASRIATRRTTSTKARWARSARAATAKGLETTTGRLTTTKTSSRCAAATRPEGALQRLPRT